MEFLPIFVALAGRRCVVVGGGEVAARKVALLRKARAQVHVVAPSLTPSLEILKASQRITHDARCFDPEDLRDAVLVIAATDDRSVNRAVSEAARARSLPVNVVDAPDLCSFIMPSIIDRSPVVVAISTGGASPVLARLLRARLEAVISPAYGRLAAWVAQSRTRVRARFHDVGARRRFWERVLSGPIADYLLSGRERAAQAALEQALVEGIPGLRGDVALVGAGPGDPDLLTLRALRLLSAADVVVYDRLVSEEVLDLARRDAERIYVGKAKNCHTVPQTEINSLLVRLAREGKRVVRLKGGDPFIFGRGGEEIATLAEAGISFQVIPGVTAASGCASYAGIPLTHRDYAHTCVFVPGHLKAEGGEIDWAALARPRQTLVVYMGLTQAGRICETLMQHGLAPETPVALIAQGTTPAQRVWEDTLATFPQRVPEIDASPPTLLIIGEVVRLRSALNWFDPTPVSLSQIAREVAG